MALAGESLFVLEMRPASYAILAANEAEKAARIKLVDYRMIGAVTEAMINQAARAGERLVLGRGAVLTPLASDRARVSGVQIEKER